MHEKIYTRRLLVKGGNTNHFYVFLKRSLQRINFTDRKATISQQIPIDWKDQVCEGAARIVKTFREKKCWCCNGC
jgi:hypothetical protein